MNYDELEREAYMAGNATLAQAYARIIELEAEVELLQDKLDSAESDSLTAWNDAYGSAKDYYDFFYECFARLAGHYPCPSIGSEYDKSVIFAAIDKGEGVTE